jgi:DNA polymerase-3 subunit alpha (Gram-positive type)
VDGLFFQRIKPPAHEFDPISIGVNGITPAMLEDAPPPEEVLPKFLDFINDSLVVAHRALFDVGFINWYCDRYGYARPRNPVLDTFKLGKELYGEPVRLDDLLKRNKIRVPVSRHKSWVDCLTTSEAFFKMVRWYTLAELSPLPFAEYDPSLYIPIR